MGDGRRKPELLAGEELIRQVRTLVIAGVLDPRDFVIAGSGPLWSAGIKPLLPDLDLVVRGASHERVVRLAERSGSFIDGIFGDRIAQLFGGRIEASARWVVPDWDTDELIDHADVIDGLRFMRLAKVEAYKLLLRRDKDVEDLLEMSRKLYHPMPPAGARPIGGRIPAQRPVAPSSRPLP